MSKDYTKIKIPQYALVCKGTGALARDGSGGILASTNRDLIVKMLAEAIDVSYTNKILYEIKEFEPTIAELI